MSRCRGKIREKSCTKHVVDVKPEVEQLKKGYDIARKKMKIETFNSLQISKLISTNQLTRFSALDNVILNMFYLKKKFII